MQSGLIHMGHRLKQILKQKKIKIVDFASMAGFTNQIAHYHLRKSDMKRSTLERFCLIIGITPEEFINWNNTTPAGAAKEAVHHGRQMQTILAEKGLNKSRLAKKMEMSRRTMYNLFEKATFTPEEMEKVTKALEMTEEAFLHHDASVEEGHKQSENDDYLLLREKYYKLLEEYNLLLKNQGSLKDALEQAKQEIVSLRKQLRRKK